jgi:uncharacterized protein
MRFVPKKLVLDTNTLISAAINPSSISGLVYKYALAHCDLYCSGETLDELDVVLKRPFMDRYFQTDAPQTRAAFLARYADAAKQVQVSIVATRCIDPKDNKFLSLVETIGADYLVSGNTKHLNILLAYAGTPILTNRQFLLEVAPAWLPNSH